MDEDDSWRGLTIRWSDDEGNHDCGSYAIEKLAVFCAMYPDNGSPTFYERRAKSGQKEPNRISPDDIKAVNAYGARSKRKLWEYLDKSVRMRGLLESIDLNGRLFESSEDEWLGTRANIKSLLGKWLAQRGIAASTATKMLHLKRPDLCPMCDSVIMRRITPENRRTKSAVAVMDCIARIRAIGVDPENNRVLHRAQQHLDRHLPDGDAYRELSLVKVLDAIIWVDSKVRTTESVDNRYWSLLGWTQAVGNSS